MRRSDRLFKIILMIGRRRVVTGQQLAKVLGVTTRTIYRDVKDLILSGVPVEGEAGVGYRLRPGSHVPAMMFTDEELQALHLGGSIVRVWADAGLAEAAAAALAKIDSVLPAELQSKPLLAGIVVPGAHVSAIGAHNFSILRGAIQHRHKVMFNYPRPFALQAERLVRPLALSYWGGSWTLGAWCETTCDFRTFRVDGMLKLRTSGEIYAQESGRGLRDYLEGAVEHDAVLGNAADALRQDEPLWPTIRK